MNPNPTNDDDLRQRFAALRRAVETDAPPWEQCWPKTPEQATRPVRLFRPRLVPLAAAAAVVLALMVSFWPRRSAVDLAEALPPLFETPTAAAQQDFLASAASAGWPSDTLYPSHLNLILP